jgi:hypothetical protein
MRQSSAHSIVAATLERPSVPTLVTGDRLREAVKRGTFIKDGDPNSAEGIKYDFRTMTGAFGGLRVIAVIVTLILGAALGGLGSYFIPKLFSH